VLSLGLFEGVVVGATGRFASFRIGKWNFEHRSRRENYCPLDDILQFTNISRPVVLHQRIHGFRWNRFDRFVAAASILLREVTDKQRNILRALAQRRNSNRKDIQAL